MGIEGIQIRQLKQEDMDGLRNLYKKLYFEYQKNVLTDDLQKYEEFLDLDLAFNIDAKAEEEHKLKTFVAVDEDEHKVVGFISGDIQHVAYLKLGFQGVVESFFIEESYRGCGLGKMLYNVLEDWFKGVGCQVIKMQTWLQNTSAIHVYEKIGFKKLNLILVKDI